MVNTIRGNNLGDASFLSIQGKKQLPIGCCFLLSLSGVEVYPPRGGNPTTSSNSLQASRSIFPLCAGGICINAVFRGTFEVQTALCAAAHTSETATRYIAREMLISGHNCRYMRNYRGGISVNGTFHLASTAFVECGRWVSNENVGFRQIALAFAVCLWYF